MKLPITGFLFCVLLSLAFPVKGQFSLSRVTRAEIDPRISLSDTVIRDVELRNEFFNESRYNVEKRLRRKERNTISLNAGTLFSQTGFDNWAAGGDNSLATRFLFNFSHEYQKNRFKFFYNFDARYGGNRVDGNYLKTEDAFIYNMGVNWAINDIWSYAANVQFRSQFARGYNARDKETRVMLSDFMAPGTLTLAVGFTYKHKEKPLVINLSPVGGSMTFVLNDVLSAAGAHGVEPNHKSKATIGSSVQIDYNTPIVKDFIKYTTYFYTFSNYTDNHYVNWKNSLDVSVFKFITLSAYCSMVYDKYAATSAAASIDDALQWNYVLGAGLSYTFKNK